MATTATIPFCQTAPCTAALGLALQKMIMSAAAAIIVIWMRMFMGSGLAQTSVTPSMTTPALANCFAVSVTPSARVTHSGPPLTGLTTS